MKLARISLTTLVAALFASCPGPAFAGWSNDPGVNFRFAPSASDQAFQLATDDGAGGTFVVWNELGNLKAQHVTASGLVAPGWPASGLTICGASGQQYPSAIAPDGAGGFLAAWDDYRNGATSDPYVQRVTANGAPLWTIDGVAASLAPGPQYSALVRSDRAGGAILAWSDERDFGTLSQDIYAQRVSAAGATLWTPNGVSVVNLAGSQHMPALISDGTVGGAYIAWRDLRAGDADVYALRLNSSGALRPGWSANGNAVAALAGDVQHVSAASDGSFGLLVSWADYRSGNYDSYLSRMTPQGTVSVGWPASGLAILPGPFDQYEQALVSDGAGGAVLVWAHIGIGDYNLFAQRVSGAGVSQWGAGVPLSQATANQYAARVVPDGAGGAVVGWLDTRAGNPPMVYAQRVTGGGTIATGFAPDGNPIATSHWVQGLSACADGAGGAIFVWQHNDLPQQGYAQHIDRWGLLGAQPRIASVRDVPGDEGGRVKLSWDPSPLDAYPGNGVSSYTLYRSVPPQAALEALAGGAAVLDAGSGDEARAANAAARAARDGRRTFVTSQLAGATVYWEYLIDVTAAQLPGYSYLAPTAQDSVAGSNPRTLFMVRAQDWSNGRHWDSDPDSAYSTDNLAPAMPAPLTGNYTAGATHLHWEPNAEPDLAGYRLYRGTSSGFVPSPGNLVGAPPDTGWADSGPAGYFYKLTALDSHGNESPPNLLTPSGTLAVEGGASWTLALAPATPNPSAAGTSCRFTLPAEGPVRFAVYDAAGRLVRVLADASMPAGEHALRWDGEREDGGRVPSGLYLARLSFAGRTLTQKIMRVR